MTSGSSVGRRPMGFFGPFNKWWSKFFLDHGRRPSKTDIEAWRADNMSWRPELTVEDIVQHSKGRRDPEKNRQYFVEYRRKMKAAAKKPARRTSRRRRHGGAAVARDVELDDEEEEEEPAEGAGEEGDEEEVMGPGQLVEGAAAQLAAEGLVSQDVKEPTRPDVGDGAAAGVLSAMPPRPCKLRSAQTVLVSSSEPAHMLAAGRSGKCSSTAAGTSSSSVPSSSEGESILPNGPAAAVISAVTAAAAAAAAATNLDGGDAAGPGTRFWPGAQLEPRSAQLSCHPSPLHGGSGGDGGDILTAACALHCGLPGLVPSRAASSALPAAQLPQLAMPSAAVKADVGVLPGGQVVAGSHAPAGVVTQIAVRRTRGPSAAARLRRGSTAALCQAEVATGGGGSGGLSHQGSISATSDGVAAAAMASCAITACGVQLPHEPLLGMLGAADFGGAWGCGGLGSGTSWAADWESQSSWPAEADALTAPLDSCEAAMAAGCVDVSTGADLGCGGVGGGTNAADGGRVGSGARWGLKLAGPAPAPILPPLSPAAACVAAAAAAKHPTGLSSASSLGAAPPVCGAKRPLDLAYAPSATSLTGVVAEPLAKHQRDDLKEQLLQRQLSEGAVSPDVSSEHSDGSHIAATSNGSCALHIRAPLSELQPPQLSPAPCEPAPAPAPPAGLPAAPSCAGAIPGGLAAGACDAAAYGEALLHSSTAGTELQRGVSPTLPAAPAPCPLPSVFTMAIPATSMADLAVPMRTGAITGLQQKQQPAASLWLSEEAEDRPLCDGGPPTPFDLAPTSAAEAEARDADEEVGAEAQGWLDSLLVDPEALDHIFTSASPRGTAGPHQRTCFGSPLSRRQPLEQEQQQEQQQQQQQQQQPHQQQPHQGLRSGVLLSSVSSNGGCVDGMSMFILV